MFYLQFKKIFIEKWANRSFLLISFFLVSDLSNLPTIIHFLWAMWANRSGRSPKMSDVSNREQIAQVAHQKWANEWIAHFWAINERFVRKTDERIPSHVQKWQTRSLCRDSDYFGTLQGNSSHSLNNDCVQCTAHVHCTQYTSVH